MKTAAASRRSAAGHILVMVLIITAILGFVTIAYIRLIISQNSFTVRSQVWNNCIPMIEAGIEEALAQLNRNVNTNFEANGWSGTSTRFAKTNELGEGYYAVLVDCTNTMAPVITCTGYVPAPVTVGSADSGILIAAATVPKPGVKYISRTVRVTTGKDPSFPNALVVKSSIDFNGNNCLVDSYKSCVAPYAAATAGDKGHVTMNGKMANVGNADIKGKLSVGPTAKVQLGPQGVVGSVAWHDSGSKGIEKGWLRNDVNVSFPDVPEPWNGGALPLGAQGSFKYYMDGGRFEVNTIKLDASETMQVKGSCVLYVKGSVDIAGTINFLPGSSLILYVKGPNCSLEGTYDGNDIPANFRLYGLPGLKTIDLNGFAAAIYAPNADVTLSGKAEFYGAAVVNSIRMNGHAGFHYDECLGDLKGTSYTISSWNEL